MEPINDSQISHSELQQRALVVERRAIFEAIFNSITDAIVFVNPKRQIVKINPAFSQMFGYQLEEIAGQTTQLIYADPAHFEKQGQVRFNPDVKIDRPKFQNEYRRKDGTTFHSETIGVPVTDESGTLLGFLGLIHDVTERKWAEDKIRENEEMFKALFEQTNGYAMILQPTSSGIPTIIDVNKAACEAHGRQRVEMIGRPITDLGGEEEKRTCIEKTKLIMSGATLDIEATHVRKDGSTFPVEVHANLVRLTDKPPVILTVEYDITERKKIESDLQKTKSELADKNKNLAEANESLKAMVKQKEKNEAQLERSAILLNESNIALKVLLKQREEDKDTLEKNVLFNVEKLLMPALAKLKNITPDGTQKAYLDILESNLSQIVSPFASKASNHLSKLSPAQIQVANLIKQGMTTKEIADLLNLSPATIAAQRQNIRKKLSLCRKTSLRAVLKNNYE